MTSERSRSSTNQATDDSPVGRVLRDEFRIDAPLGSGGMSTVYRAHQLSVDRKVVIKVMTPPEHRFEEWRARFLQEARAASKVNHPGIVTIYSFGEEPGVGPYIAMEFVDGVGLRTLLAAVGQFEPVRACRLMAGVCRAMHDAHEAGVVHRDLKPDNIMIEKRDDREVPRVLDFGVAKPSDAMVNTLDTEVVGTPDYMAPEQARKNPVDARTDVYSAGIILYELVFGSRPFFAPEPLQIMFKHVNQPLPLDDFDPQWPSRLRDVLERACSKDPDERFQTAREMALALEEIVDAAESADVPDLAPREVGAVSAEMVAPVATPGPRAHESEGTDDRNGVADQQVHQRPTSLVRPVDAEEPRPERPTNEPEAPSGRGSFVGLLIAGLVALVAAAAAIVMLWPERPVPPAPIPPNETADPPDIVVQELPGRETPEPPSVDATRRARAANGVARAVATAAGASDQAATDRSDEHSTEPGERPFDEARHEPENDAKAAGQADDDDIHLIAEPPPPRLNDPFGDEE